MPTSKNLFCRSDDLSNEASVESFFVLRLLAMLGYRDGEIRTKNAIDELRVGKGRKKEPYRPDFLLICKGKPRWIIDAKSPGENPDDFTEQGAGYCLAVNMKFDENPVHYYMLTNGFLTRVHRWDKEQPVLSLRFADFVEGNTKFQALAELLGADAARSGWSGVKPQGATHELRRPSMEEVKKTFHRCHRIIWKSEKVSPQAAFLRFAKLLFVKLWEDRRLRDDPRRLEAIGRGDPLPADDVAFSTHWIEQQEKHEENPVDRILFRKLVESLEEEIQQRKRKRIFGSDARLDVSAGTVKRIVAELEHQYLFGIDEDLNGRMFEAFLVATMRGQELGQYFTPRSIVKLITELGRPVASRTKVERVLDGCCGTGGFLIEVLTEMRRQIYENTSLTNAERNRLLNEVANEAIFGVDAGQDPPLAKIARINMYLHGDGGSRIYMTDGLHKTPSPSGTDDAEVRQEVSELRKVLRGDTSGPLQFDLVLTNPPFSMDYSATVPDEAAVLSEYELASWDGKPRTRLRSAVLFMERYHGLLRPGGRLFTVIDDSVLGGTKTAFVRDFLRKRFIINGVVSLHGDAFWRAGARAKTSILCLTKRNSEDEEQPDVFVYESRFIGLDDVAPKTPASVAAKARTDAEKEIETISAAYSDYLAGKKGAWLVPASRLSDRLDAKHLRPWSVAGLEQVWKKLGIGSNVLSELVDPIEEEVNIKPDEVYTFLRVTYDGEATKGESRLGREISYTSVGRARANDVVVSNINGVNGATCVLPEELDGLLVTSEFTVLRVKAGRDADPMYLWSVLRSEAVRAEWLSAARGFGRHRVGWDLLKNQRVPFPPTPQQREIGDLYRREHSLRREILTVREHAAAQLERLDLSGKEAKDRLLAAKPPR